jgi:GH43 family beta-xylosidase
MKRWRAIATVFALMAMASSVAATRAEAATQPLRPPVLDRDAPDPTLVRAGDSYYAFTTDVALFGGLVNVPVSRSSDLDTWTLVRDALPALGSWATPGLTWAPSVAQIGGKWILYYTARDTVSSRQCIGVAVASNVDGPYTDTRAAPLVCQVDRGGSIDASPYTDAHGTKWLTWKSEENTFGGTPGIWSQALTANGLSLAGSATLLMVSDRPWERGIVEAPVLFDASGKLWLFYSAAPYASAEYAVGYAVCAGPAGPCANQTTDAPWLSMGTTGIGGPGGQSFVTTSTGRIDMAFHGWRNAIGNENGGYRAMYIEPIDFDSGVPTLRPDWGRLSGLSAPIEHWYLHNTVGPGAADLRFDFGLTNYTSVVGDWDGNTTQTPGVFDKGTWYLRNSNDDGAPDIVVDYGAPGYVPVVGDWDGDGTDTIGVYVDGWWYLRNSNTPGPPDVVVHYGAPGYTPVVGDWDGDGTDTIGVYVGGWWYLRNSNDGGPPVVTLDYGATGYTPFVGRWTGRSDGVGIVM